MHTACNPPKSLFTLRSGSVIESSNRGKDYGSVCHRTDERFYGSRKKFNLLNQSHTSFSHLDIAHVCVKWHNRTWHSCTPLAYHTLTTTSFSHLRVKPPGRKWATAHKSTIHDNLRQEKSIFDDCCAFVEVASFRSLMVFVQEEHEKTITTRLEKLSDKNEAELWSLMCTALTAESQIDFVNLVKILTSTFKTQSATVHILSRWNMWMVWETRAKALIITSMLYLHMDYLYGCQV